MARRLGEILVRYYRLPERAVEDAAAVQHALGKRLGQVLIDLGVLTEQDLARALAFQHHVPVALNLAESPVEPDVIRLIPPVIAAWENVLPLSSGIGSDGRPHVVIAMTDPSDKRLLRELEEVTKCRVEPAVATEADLRAAIRRHYGKRTPLRAVAAVPAAPVAPATSSRSPARGSAADPWEPSGVTDA